MMHIVFLSLFFIGLSACSMVQRHPDSGYANEFLRPSDDVDPEVSFKTGSSTWNPPVARFARKGEATAPGRMPQALIAPARSAEISELVHSSDLGLGMSQADVRESWGNPMRREVAGQATLGNERWTYREFLPTKEGYTPQDRVVYFYQGKVIGWKTNK